jgi:hypothetical protein
MAKILMKLMIGAVVWGGVAAGVWAQEEQAQPTTSETSVPNQNPARTTESHSKSGNSAVDTQRVEVMGPDGRYTPAAETETETVRVDATTTRTTVKTYQWDGNGQRKLATVSEQESKSGGDGDTQTVRTTSTSDIDGKFQVVSREVADTKKTSPDTRETKSTFYVADGNGGFTRSAQTDESQTTGADHTVAVKKTTMVPDGNGGWQVGEQKETTVKQEGKTQTTEERTSTPDTEGKLAESSRTVVTQGESPTGERVQTVQKYSTDVVGAAGDGKLHMAQQVTTVQKKTEDGEVTEQEVVEPNVGNPSDGPQATRKTKYSVLYGASGAQQTTTTKERDANGNFGVVSVETRKSGESKKAEEKKSEETQKTDETQKAEQAAPAPGQVTEAPAEKPQ